MGWALDSFMPFYKAPEDVVCGVCRSGFRGLWLCLLWYLSASGEPMRAPTQPSGEACACQTAGRHGGPDAFEAVQAAALVNHCRSHGYSQQFNSGADVWCPLAGSLHSVSICCAEMQPRTANV